MASLAFYSDTQKKTDRDNLVWFIQLLPNAVASVLETGARKIDNETVTRIVGDAKAHVAEDTGRLLNGITGGTDARGSYVEAKAISPDGRHENYAFFVEKGHRSGGSGVADGGYFSGDGSSALGGVQGRAFHSLVAAGAAANVIYHRRRVVESLENAPHPFFYPAALGGLAEREQKAEELFGKFYDFINFKWF